MSARSRIRPITARLLGSYGLMDFRMGVGKDAWTASLFGTNLTNKHAPDHRQYGLRLAAADDHARLDQSAAHHRHSFRHEVLKALTG